MSKSFTEFGIEHNLSDDELVKIIMEQLNMDEQDAYLMLDIERDGTGDIIQDG